MEDFYQAWLADSERIEKAVSEGLRLARAKDLEWTRTRQDAKAALMIAPETGFTTGGSLLMKAEIPVGWRTGKHLHGEEAIYVAFKTIGMKEKIDGYGRLLRLL